MLAGGWIWVAMRSGLTVPNIFAARLAKIGKHRHGKSCLYIKSLADVDTKELGKLIADSVAYMQKKCPAPK